MKAFNEWLKSAIEVVSMINVESYFTKTVRFQFYGKQVFFFTLEYTKEFKSKKKSCNFELLLSNKNSAFWNIKRLFAHYDDEQKHAEQYCDVMQDKFEMEKCVGHGNRNARGGL